MSDLQVSIKKKPAFILLIIAIVTVLTLVFFANVRASQPYRTCLQLYQATGQYAVPKGSKLYVPALDRNGDGIACSEKP